MKKYLDIKTIEVSDLVAEYMVKLFFNYVPRFPFKKECFKIVEIDNLINEHLSNITHEEIKEYIKKVNKQDYKNRPCFAFISNNLITNPLRLYLNSYIENKPVCIENFSLASDYYTLDLETNTFCVY